MRKISFLVLVYFLTTAGLFKSALEDCADESFEYSNSIPSIEYKNVELSKESYQKLLNEHERYKKEALKEHFALPICKDMFDSFKFPKCRNETSSGYSYEKTLDHLFRNDTLVEARRVKIKEYTETEMKSKYKIFFKKPLKIKMDNSEYYKNYSGCLDYKKRSPELFEAQYN